MDLANTTWLYSFGGFDLPVEVKLVNGEASSDGDGVDDAAALLSRAQSNGYEALWYAWLADGADAVQVKYPIARTGRCGTLVETPVIAEGAVNLTEYLRIPGLDDAIPCSDPGTGLKKRSITIHAEGQEAWPVQTAPVAAWGGLCPGARWDETSPGVVDLWAAPAKNAPVTATKGPDGGAMFEQKDAPLMQRDGWLLLGVKLSGMANEQGVTEMECAWALK